jgi:hypothetical protein
MKASSSGAYHRLGKANGRLGSAAHGKGAGMSRFRVALIQLAADQDVAANVDRAAALVQKAGEAAETGVAVD